MTARGGGEVIDTPGVRSTVRCLGICFCVMSGVGSLLKDCEREGISSDLYFQAWLGLVYGDSSVGAGLETGRVRRLFS